jgi:leader peptidase (prepilin peptidase)/N-methyltransferase
MASGWTRIIAWFLAFSTGQVNRATVQVLVLRDFEPLATTWGAYAFAVLLGLLWGSFANVCIYRWPPTDEHPKGRSVVAPGSHCFACQTPIRWYDNAPLISWLWLRGKCRTCKAPFSARYLIVEALTGVLFGIVWWVTMQAGALTEPFDARLLRFAIYAGFCFVMVVIAFIDVDHKLILDKVTLPSIVIFYGAGLLLGRSWEHGLIGALVGYGLPWSIAEIYFLLMEREGLGLGDSKLLAVIGALLGSAGVVASLFGGALFGSVVGVLVLLRAPTTPDAADAADAEAQRPGQRLAPALLMVAAVVSVLLASVAFLLDRVHVALFSLVIAMASLVVSRRFDRGTEDAGAHDAEEPAPADAAPSARVPGRELAIRILALVSACCVLIAVTAVMFGVHLIGLVGGVVGVGLLLLAGRLRGAGEGADAAEPLPEPEPSGPPSLMRTELPFGPFLAIAAVLYLVGEPWIVLNFRFLGG